MMSLPPVQKTWLLYTDQEDPPEERMAFHASILAWRIPWAEDRAWQAAVHGGCEDLDMTERLTLTQELNGQVAQVPLNTLLPSSPAWTPPSTVPLSHGVAPPKGARGSSVPCPHFLQELGSMSLKTVCLMPNVCIREQKIDSHKYA